jgi:hypothetical protein
MFEETVKISRDYFPKQYRLISVAFELHQAVQAVKLFVIQLSVTSLSSKWLLQHYAVEQSRNVRNQVSHP